MITTEETEGKESPPTSSGRDSRHSARIGAADSPECPDCDQEDTVHHVSNECQRGEEMRRRLGGSDDAHIIDTRVTSSGSFGGWGARLLTPLRQ